MKPVRPATASERPAALRLLLRHLAPQRRGARASGLLGRMAAGEIPAEGLLVYRGLAGAVLAVPQAGAGGLLFPPAADTAACAAVLVEEACAWLRRQGARFAQAIVGPDQDGQARHLLANGFFRVTAIIKLAHSLGPGAGTPAEGRMACGPYEAAAFHDAFRRSCEGSVDCPELGALRTAEEMIAAHKAPSRFDPALWWLAREGDEPAGVVIQHDAGGEREVAYLGLAPAARGRGLGRELMLRVLAEARAAGRGRVALAADERNAPARRLYESLGFEEVGREQMYLRVGP